MSKGLLQIEPTELKFIFELKKQSSCSVQLTNTTNRYVAFKVKTTSPKKYSVRPHIGVLMPKSTYVFVVTMQAQRAALVDMVCKDKFLIQSTVVPAGTTNDDITSSWFVKDSSRYVEENKLKVALISQLHSPEVSPTNGDFQNELALEKDKIFSRDEILSPEPMVIENVEVNINNELKHEYGMKLKPAKDIVLNTAKDVKEQKPEKEGELKVLKDVELNTANDVEELKSEKAAELKVSKGVEELKLMESIEELKVSKDVVLNAAKDVEEPRSGKQAELKVSKRAEELKLMESIEELKVSKDVEWNAAKDVKEPKSGKAEIKVPKGVGELKLMESIEEMKLKLDEIESKLNEAGVTISKLTEERMASNLESNILQEKLADLSKRDARSVHVGFPFLYVCMVALICLFLGYRLHS